MRIAGSVLGIMVLIFYRIENIMPYTVRRKLPHVNFLYRRCKENMMTVGKTKRNLSKRKRAYIEEHYRRFSNSKLAKALGIDKKIVRQIIGECGLERSADEEQNIRDNSANPPEYLAELPLPRERAHLNPRLAIPALFILCLTFIIYLLTLAPTVTGEDSGELITAAYTLGIAHPPGYPLWCLLGKLFSFIPVGNIAFRINMMSAFWASFAAACLFLVSFTLTKSTAASLSAALSFSFLVDVWAQSTIAEVYTLNIFLISLLLLLSLQYYYHRDVRLIFFSALVAGLAAAHHNTAAPFIGLIPSFFVFISPWRLFRPRILGASVLLFLVGMSAYLYLPIRSASNPVMDWGNPETLRSVFDHIFRQQYAFGFTENARTLPHFFGQLSSVAKMTASQATILFPLLACTGLYLLWRKDKHIFFFFSGILLLSGPLLILVVNFQLEREPLETVKPFFLPVYLIMALLFALSLAHAVRASGNTKIRYAVSIVAVSLFLVPLGRNFRKNDKSRDYLACDFGMNLLKTIEQNGIIFSSSDYSTFVLIYLQTIEGLRQDIVIADKYGYIEKNLYDEMPHDVTSTFRKIPTPQERHMIERWIISNTPRPVFFTKKRDMQDLPALELVSWGLAYKVVEREAPVKKPQNDLWSEYDLRMVEYPGKYRDYTADSILCDYHFARGRDYLRDNDVPSALQEFELAGQYGSGVKEIYNNLGSACAENGLVSRAIGYFLTALEIDPAYMLPLRNIARLYEYGENYLEAIDYTKRILEINPDEYETVLHLAALYERSGQIEDAITTYKKAIRMAPEDFRPLRSLGFILWSIPGARHDAMLALSGSLERNPNQPDLQQLLTKKAAAAYEHSPQAGSQMSVSGKM